MARFADAAPAGKVLASELLELLAEQGPERGIRPPQCQFAAVHFDALLACAVSANEIRIAIAAWPRDNDRLQSIGGAARSLKIEALSPRELEAERSRCHPEKHIPNTVARASGVMCGRFEPEAS